MLSASSRIEAKKRAILDPKQQQFVKPQWEKQNYQHRMNFYTIPPTEDIALEDFEEWGIARLKVLAELEACHFRNRSSAETEEYMRPVLEKWLRLESNQSRSQDVQMQRKKDHYSHWTLRLAFASTADLRQRFTRLETQLFKLRLQADNSRERREFIDSLPMSWEMLDAGEKNTWLSELRAATSIGKDDEENWFKVDWEKVPELVERRQVLLKKGKAYVHVREQTTMVLSEFTRSLETGLELAARFLPRMDEDNRLAPILHHLSQSFVAPDASYNENSGVSDIANINAGSIDGLSSHFPLCMQNLHRELRKNSHLKHQSRLQYTLFLKGIGLNMQECIVFWRKAFKLITDGKSPKISTATTQREHTDKPAPQKSSNPNTSTTSATATATSAATPTSAAAATRLSAARNCSQNHSRPPA
jgi:DNA primase large subunit